MNGGVGAVAASASDIYVGGLFQNGAGILEADSIALWDGSSWHALDKGLDGDVVALARIGEDILVGGWFHNAGGNPDAEHIARWDSDTCPAYLPLVLQNK